MGILVVLPITAAIALLDRKRIENFFFLGISLIILFILIAGYSLGSPVPGVYAGIGIGIVSAIYCTVILFRDRDRFKEYVLTPGLWVTLISVAVSGLVLVNKTDLGDANDTFWAHIPQVLNMYRNSNIGNIGRVSVNYTLLYTVPVYNSWCYFCNKLWFSYSDGINIWARQIFIMSGFMPFFSFAEKKEWKKVLLISLIIMLIPGMIRPQYDFMPDIPMGAMTIYGTLMMIKFFRDNDRVNDGWCLLAGCLCLLFTYVMKRMGGIYTFGMTGVVVVYTLDRYFSKKQKLSFFRKALPLVAVFLSTILTYYFNNFRNKYYSPDILVTILPFVSFVVFVAMGVYCWCIKYFFIKERTIAAISLMLMFYAAMIVTIPFLAGKARFKVLEKDQENMWGVFHDFFSMWFTADPGEKRFGNGWLMSDLVFVMILLMVLLIIRRLLTLAKISFIGTVSDMDNGMTVVFTGYTIYMLFYLFLCMFIQGGYASDGDIYWTIRYHGPAVMLVTAVVLYELLSIKSIYTERILISAAAFLMLLLPHNPFMVMNLSSEPYWDLYNEMFEKAGVELTEDNNVFCVGPDHVYYYSFPAKVYQDYDVIAGEAEPEEFAALARGYDYLIIEDCDRNFTNAYQDMFEGGVESIQDFSVYDIKSADDGSVTFVKREAVN